MRPHAPCRVAIRFAAWTSMTITVARSPRWRSGAPLAPRASLAALGVRRCQKRIHRRRSGCEKVRRRPDEWGCLWPERGHVVVSAVHLAKQPFELGRRAWRTRRLVRWQRSRKRVRHRHCRTVRLGFRRPCARAHGRRLPIARRPPRARGRVRAVAPFVRGAMTALGGLAGVEQGPNPSWRMERFHL
jgi:hypothetical protein